MAIELMPGMRISASGLNAERLRMEITANNLANMHSTRDVNGKVYQRRQVVFSAVLAAAVNGTSATGLGGVHVDGIVKDTRPPIEISAPGHPNADENGMIQEPNISPIEEMLEMMTATRAYEANLSAVKQSRDMANQTIALGKNTG